MESECFRIISSDNRTSSIRKWLRTGGNTAGVATRRLGNDDSNNGHSNRTFTCVPGGNMTKLTPSLATATMKSTSTLYSDNSYITGGIWQASIGESICRGGVDRTSVYRHSGDINKLALNRQLTRRRSSIGRRRGSAKTEKC